MIIALSLFSDTMCSLIMILFMVTLYVSTYYRFCDAGKNKQRHLIRIKIVKQILSFDNTIC
jgi:hypothetical protein